MSNIRVGNSTFSQSRQAVSGLNELLRTRYQENSGMAAKDQQQDLLNREAEIYAQNKEKAHQALDAVLGESLESPKLSQFGMAISNIGAESGNALTDYHRRNNYLNTHLSALDPDKMGQTPIGEVQIRMAELNKFMVDSGLLETMRGGGGFKTKLAIALRKIPFLSNSISDPFVKKLTEDLKASESLENMAAALKNSASRLQRDSENMLQEERLSYEMELKLYQDYKFLMAIHEAAVERLEAGREEMMKQGTWTDEHEKVYYSKILLPIVSQITAIHERLLVSYNLRHVRKSNQHVNEILFQEVNQISTLTLPAIATTLSNLVIAHNHRNIQELTRNIKEMQIVAMEAANATTKESMQMVQQMREDGRNYRQIIMKNAEDLKRSLDNFRNAELQEYGKYVQEIQSFANGNYKNSNQHEMEMIKEIQKASGQLSLEDQSGKNVQFGTKIPQEALPVYAKEKTDNPISAILKG